MEGPGRRRGGGRPIAAVAWGITLRRTSASEPLEGAAIRIKVVSDIHGAAEQLRVEAAGADVLLVCGDLLNLIDYGSLQGIMADVYGPEATRRFAKLRTAGRFDEAGQVLRQGIAGREGEIRGLVRAASRAQYEAVFAAFPERTYLTHGNADFPEQFRDLLRPGIHHLDGEAVEVDGLCIGFVGGGLPRGSRPHLSEVPEAEFAAKVGRLPRVDVLCSHMPPRIDDLCFDVVADRPEPGSQALLDYVEEHQPDYLYFGHVHQPRVSRMLVGRTRLVNVGHFRATGQMLLHPVE